MGTLRRLFNWLNAEPDVPAVPAQDLPDPPSAPSASAAFPFDVPMTPRQAEILDFGWELMKHQNSGHLFPWLEEDGWTGGHELTAWPHAPGQIAAKIKPWETLVMPLYTTLN